MEKIFGVQSALCSVLAFKYPKEIT